MKTTFEVRYPWGSRYMDGLMRGLDIQGAHLMHDPRSEGSDQWGVFVARDAKALEGLEGLIQVLIDDAPVDDDGDADWEVLDQQIEAELNARGAVRLETDWKHLEVDEHVEALAGIGLSLERLDDADGPTFVLSGGEADFAFHGELPADIAKELCSLMGDRRSRNRALDALRRSPQGAAIGGHLLHGCLEDGQLVDPAELSRYWGVRKTEHVLELVLAALAVLPDDQRAELGSLDVTALESLPSSVGDLPGLEVLSSEGEDFWQTALQLPSSWPHRPRQLRIHRRKVMPLPSDLFVEDDRSPVEVVDLLESLAWLPRTLWDNNVLRTLRVELDTLPQEDHSGWNSDLAFTPKGLKGLEELHLGGDYEQLPAWIGELSGLRRLTLNSSNLKRLPDELGQLSRLEVLDIGGCPALETVPDSLLDCSRLRAVRLVGGVVEDAMGLAFNSPRWGELPRGIAEHPGLELLIVDGWLADGLREPLAALIQRGVPVYRFSEPHPSMERLLRQFLDKDPVADVRPEVNRDVEVLIELAAMESMFGAL